MLHIYVICIKMALIYIIHDFYMKIFSAQLKMIDCAQKEYSYKHKE